MIKRGEKTLQFYIKKWTFRSKLVRTFYIFILFDTQPKTHDFLILLAPQLTKWISKMSWYWCCPFSWSCLFWWCRNKSSMNRFSLKAWKICFYIKPKFDCYHIFKISWKLFSFPSGRAMFYPIYSETTYRDHLY